jgi:hypothetical protein
VHRAGIGQKRERALRRFLSSDWMQPADEAAEVVADGSETGVGCTALAMPEVIAAHSMLGFEMADGRLDGGTPAEFAFDLRRHPPLLP